MKKYLTLIIVFCIALFSGCGASNKNQETSKSNSVICDKSLYPLVHELVENYNANSKENIDLKLVNEIDSVEKSKENEQIIISYKNKKFEKYKKEELATDGIAIVVNKDNKIDNIDMEKLNDIYSGLLKNWSELNGKDSLINVVVYDNINKFLEKSIKDKVDSKVTTNFNNKFKYVKDIDAIKKEIKEQKNTLAFIPMMHLNKEDKFINLNGVKLNKNNIKNSLYNMTIPIEMYYGNKVNSSLNDFITYVKSDNGKKIIKKYCVDKNS